ncbi:phosphoglycolate phosphatase [Amaricoccus macauensis]|uniref:phosphoglycolate phosphatase n=1 Tax=Amaricoccus macauensis TaxID=57001 RepID=A0A840SPM5_9RHOB|nr:HAD family hydrolase [Amaricoccus macauensis]MBB5221241.1 phosphoglycolate phosphatase [Amaricoccus macauensis]
MSAVVDPRTIRGLIFDKDGTLFDFHATWSVWANGLIDRLSGVDPSKAELLAEGLADRLGFDRATRRFLPQSAVIAGTMEVVIDAIRSTLPALEEAPLRRMILASTAAAEQVEVAPLGPLLDRLIAGGMTLGLATNDSEEPARAHLERAGVLGRFAFVAGYDSGHGAKPMPGMLTAFCAATGIAPANCAMIGDSTHDLESGRAAGMTAVAVLTGIATEPDLAPHADVVLPSVEALPGWLGLA